MTLLATGLALFLGAHLVPALPALREELHDALGAGRYRAAFSVIALAGLVLTVVGYRAAEPGARLFAPLPAAIALAPYAMVVAFVLLAAANLRAHLRRAARHPMLLGTLLWSGVHLLANGDARGTLLFGAFLAWAAIDLASAIARAAVKPFEPTARHDAIAVVAGTATALAVMVFHRALFGPAVVAFGA
jgi:uncharacterized membrane protein